MPRRYVSLVWKIRNKPRRQWGSAGEKPGAERATADEEEESPGILLVRRLEVLSGIWTLIYSREGQQTKRKTTISLWRFGEVKGM